MKDVLTPFLSTHLPEAGHILNQVASSPYETPGHYFVKLAFGLAGLAAVGYGLFYALRDRKPKSPRR